MVYLRNIIFWIVLVVYTFFYFVAFVILAIPFYKYRHNIGTGWALSFEKFLHYIIGLKYQVVGLENVPKEPVIIASKHQSGYETITLQAFLPHQVFVMKKSLLLVPLVGQGFLFMSPIAIDRSKGSKSSKMLMELGAKRKKSGFCITIFPEGTRMKPGVTKGYKRGAARMAVGLEMDLLPIGVNSGEYWPKNSFWKYPGTVTFVVGKPISHTLGDEYELTEYLENTVETYQSWITKKDHIDLAELEKLLKEEEATREERYAKIKAEKAEENQRLRDEHAKREREHALENQQAGNQAGDGSSQSN